MVDGLDLVALKERENLLSENIVKRWYVKVEIAESNKEVNWSSVCWSEYLLAPAQKEKLYFNSIHFGRLQQTCEI